MRGPNHLNEKSSFFSDWCLISPFSSMLITSVNDNGNHPVQNRRLFAESWKNPHIYSSYQFCLVKVLLVTIAFEDGVRVDFMLFYPSCEVNWQPCFCWLLRRIHALSLSLSQWLCKCYATLGSTLDNI